MTHRTVRARFLSTHWLVLFLILLGMSGVILAGTASANSWDTGLRPTMISVTFGGLAFMNTDMNSTYGMAPAVGVRLAKQMDERAEFFLGFQYGKDSATPYDTPDFRTGKETVMKQAPITFGARVNTTNSPRYLFYFGLAARYFWMSETRPWGSQWDDPAEPEYSGWGWGLRFLIGPEWRDPSGRFGVGFEAAFGYQAADVEHSGDERHVDLSGADLRFYVSGLF